MSELMCRESSGSPVQDGPPGQDRRTPAAAVRSSGGAAKALRWRPWVGRPRIRDLVCLAGLVLSSVYGLAMIPITPSLIATRPVLLELLSGSTPSIVAAGAFSDVSSKLQMTVVVAAALVGLMKFDLLFWWAGRLWGHRAVQWLGEHSGRTGAIARMAEQRGSRLAGAAVLLSGILPGVPAPLVYAAAGWVGLGLVPFVVFDVIGSAAWAAMLAAFGYELGPSGVAAANIVSHYALLAIIAALVAVAAPHAWHIIRARRARARRALAALGLGPTVDADAMRSDDTAGAVL